MLGGVQMMHIIALLLLNTSHFITLLTLRMYNEM